MRCRVVSLLLIGLTLHVQAEAMNRSEGRKIVNELRRAHRNGEYGIRLVSDATIEGDDRPDPERPYPIRLPDGREVYAIGLSGLHVIVLGNTAEPFSSMKALGQYRARGGIESFSGKLSGGAFDGTYGAFSAVGKSNLENLRLVVDDTDELYDLAKILTPLFVWRGRPVEFELTAGDRVGLAPRQRMIALHGVARSAVHPEAFTDRPPQVEYVRDFKRQILTFPVERVRGPDGREYEILKDNTGLLEILLRYATPKLRRLYREAQPLNLELSA